MKNDKFCFSKKTGVISLIGVAVVAAAFFMGSLASKQTSTNTRASESSIVGGVTKAPLRYPCSTWKSSLLGINYFGIQPRREVISNGDYAEHSNEICRTQGIVIDYYPHDDLAYNKVWIRPPQTEDNATFFQRLDTFKPIVIRANYGLFFNKDSNLQIVEVIVNCGDNNSQTIKYSYNDVRKSYVDGYISKAFECAYSKPGFYTMNVSAVIENNNVGKRETVSGKPFTLEIQ